MGGIVDGTSTLLSLSSIPRNTTLLVLTMLNE
jgi:hypothetical protein